MFGATARGLQEAWMPGLVVNEHLETGRSNNLVSGLPLESTSIGAMRTTASWSISTSLRPRPCELKICVPNDLIEFTVACHPAVNAHSDNEDGALPILVPRLVIGQQGTQETCDRLAHLCHI